MRRFFYDASLPDCSALSHIAIDSEFDLPPSVVHHWCQVLRGKTGQQAVLFDGLGGEYQVELIHVSKKLATVRLLDFTDMSRTPNFITCIGLVMSRGDRMDYAIQKATEMGVTAIQLLTSHHGEVHLKPAQVAKKLNHWQQVAISACEQSGLNHPPIIFSPMSIASWVLQDKVNWLNICDYMQNIAQHLHYQALSNLSDIDLILSAPQTVVHEQRQYQNNGDSDHLKKADQEFVVDKENLPTQSLNQRIIAILNEQSHLPYIRLLIGAEGGFSHEEISLALKQNWQAWQIGGRVLRTETAPVVSLATLQAWQYSVCT